MNDGSLEIFFYIVAVIGAIVLSGIKSYRKFKEQSAPIPLEEEYEQWQDEEVKPPTRNEGQARPQVKVQLADVDLSRYQEVEKKRKQAQERDRRAERDQRFAALFRDKEHSLEEKGGGTAINFDIKEAIIYSEIVNRKYE
jgi:hypothetical protein